MNDYQALYTSESEPWNYSGRAAELLRHEIIAEELSSLGLKFSDALDVGSSLGQLTRKLRPLSKNVTGCDVSSAAVQKAEKMPENAGIKFLAAGLPGLPFAENAFDLIVVADGIHEFVPQDKRDSALKELRGVLKNGGTILFSDYMRPGNFEPFIRLISAHFSVIKLVYLNDRLWYQFESWFKAVRGLKISKYILSRTWIARAFRPLAKCLGAHGSTHILILAQKNGQN